ncbi:MAG: hypothetical protein RLN72_02775 [Henriciella sp.]
MRLQTVFAVALLALTACQSADGDTEIVEAGVDPTLATLSGEACPDVGDKAFFFWMETRSAEPGDKVALHPYWTDMPGGYNDVPAGCLDELSVHPDGAASFERQEDGLAIATISPAVAPGTMVLLNGTYLGHGLVGRVDVFSTAANPLVGTWRQREEDCPNGSPIRELVFTGGGDFSVTWTPFEVYKDYWGVYEYDAESNAFRFAVEGGNQVPEDIETQGTVIIENGELDFGQVVFGTPGSADAPCTANFVQ